MVLHLEEFQQKDPQLGKFLNYYDKLPEYLHEMSVEDIMKHINRNGVRSWYLQQRAVLDYFMWLHNNYDINLTEKFFELQQVRNSCNSLTETFSQLVVQPCDPYFALAVPQRKILISEPSHSTRLTIVRKNSLF